MTTQNAKIDLNKFNIENIIQKNELDKDLYDQKKKINSININNEVDVLKKRREERKQRNEGRKNKIEEESNSKCDLDYEKLIIKKKINFRMNFHPHTQIMNEKIFVIVRKRPIFPKEVSLGEIDCLSALNPSLYIHEPKIKIDGITKYIEDHEFIFDNVFGDHEKTEQIFQSTIEPTIDLLFSKGIVTCFAYGQTGSGKTFTMRGIQKSAIKTLFDINNKEYDIYITFFEIYGETLYDLLNSRNKLQVLEDKNQVVQIFGLEEKLVTSPEDLEDLINKGNSERTTHNTVTNETSSRSHAICNILIKEKGNDEIFGKLTLVDLAGSERAQETQSNIKERMNEGAKINKSLLALKECIRALDTKKLGNDNHVPFRNSKLTLVLRDSFLPKNPDKAKIIMIACVSPCYNSANHTLNTLRYSDRLKEKTKKKIKSYINSNNKLDKLDDIDFDDKDYFIKQDMDYDDDLLIEDKVQDLESAKEGMQLENNRVRPVKPQVKTSFKPRTKSTAISSNNINPNINQVHGSSNSSNIKDLKSNRLEMNKIQSSKDNNLNGKFIIILS